MPQMTLGAERNDFSAVLRTVDMMGDATITGADSRLFWLAIPGGPFFRIGVDGLTTEVVNGRTCLTGGVVSWIRIFDSGGGPIGAVRKIAVDGAVFGAWLQDEWSNPGSTALEDWLHGADWRCFGGLLAPFVLAPVVTADGVAIMLAGNDSIGTNTGNDTIDAGPGDDFIRVRGGLNDVTGGEMGMTTSAVGGWREASFAAAAATMSSA